MIFLPKKDFDSPPIALTKATACWTLRSATLTPDGNLCTSYYYADKSVVDLLRAYSVHEDFLAANEAGKCNYCESRLEHGVTFQVEHFRPKAKVAEIDNGGLPHSGYYWLGLEWSNLLLSCPKCNGKGAKGSRFPIRGVRATAFHPVDATGVLNRAACYLNTNPLLAEDPLLLNPEIDHPEQFLTFNTNGYIVSHGADQLRGDTSIEIYRLNRDLLVAERIDVLNQFLNRINIDIAAHMIGTIGDDTLIYNFKVVVREMIARQSPKKEFALWARYFNEEIESCVIAYLPRVPYNDMFRDAHHEVLAE